MKSNMHRETLFKSHAPYTAKYCRRSPLYSSCSSRTWEESRTSWSIPVPGQEDPCSNPRLTGQPFFLSWKRRHRLRSPRLESRICAYRLTCLCTFRSPSAQSPICVRIQIKVFVDAFRSKSYLIRYPAFRFRDALLRALQQATIDGRTTRYGIFREPFAILSPTWLSLLCEADYRAVSSISSRADGSADPAGSSYLPDFVSSIRYRRRDLFDLDRSPPQWPQPF